MGLFGQSFWLPLSFLLYEQDAVSAVFIAYSNEYWFAFARDEYIFFFMYGDAVSCEDRDGDIVRSFPTLINDVRELVNVSDCAVCLDNCGKGSQVTCFALYVLRFVTLTLLLGEGKMVIRASVLSSLLT